MGTRGVPPCSLHTCAWSGTCLNKCYLLFGEGQVCVAHTGHRHARVVGSAPIARGPRSQCRSRPWWRRCQCLQPGFHMSMWTWWVLCQPPRVATPTSSPWWTDLQDGQRKKKSEEWGASGHHFRQRCPVHLLKVVFLVQAGGGQAHHHHNFPPPVQWDGREVPQAAEGCSEDMWGFSSWEEQLP